MGARLAVAKKQNKPGPKPGQQGTRDTLIAVKCRKEFKDWVIRFAESRRVAPSQLIDIALAQMAEADKFEPPPKR